MGIGKSADYQRWGGIDREREAQVLKKDLHKRKIVIFQIVWSCTKLHKILNYMVTY